MAGMATPIMDMVIIPEYPSRWDTAVGTAAGIVIMAVDGVEAGTIMAEAGTVVVVGPAAAGMVAAAAAGTEAEAGAGAFTTNTARIQFVLAERNLPESEANSVFAILLMFQSLVPFPTSLVAGNQGAGADDLSKKQALTRNLNSG